jgi:simple sugar transport system substrate-binding protein
MNRRVVRPVVPGAPSGGLPRRDFLRAGGLGAATLLAGGGLLAACGDSGEGGGAAAGGGGETVKIAFAYNGPTSDGGWTYSHDLGRKAVEKAYPNVETTFVENVPFSEEASQTFERLAADGNKMVFACSEWGDFLSTVAEKYPDVIFMEAGGDSYADNLYAYYVKQYLAAYVIGVAAGMLTESNKLGYIASFPVPVVKNTASALLLGARSVNPDAFVQVVSINSWFDPQAAGRAATALIDGGADFTIGIMDEPTYLQVSRKRDVWTAGWNVDMRKFAPEVYVSSATQSWDDYYVKTIGSFLDGNLKVPSEAVLLDLPDGTDRSPWGDNVPAEVQAKADEARDRIINEDFNPFIGPLNDSSGKSRLAEGEELSAYETYTLDWAVEGVKGNLG